MASETEYTGATPPMHRRNPDEIPWCMIAEAFDVFPDEITEKLVEWMSTPESEEDAQ